jgi:hypothetical protein
MATTTNYSWTTPDDTALVKDGAAAIRSLGTAIDTTVFNNASTGIAKTIVDAKGDLIAATASDTVARLAVGTNGQVLKADSTAATGLVWGSVTSKIVQVVQGTKTTSSSTASGAASDTGLTVTITPTSASSTIMVIASFDGETRNGVSSTTNQSPFFLLRGATQLQERRFGSYNFASTNSPRAYAPIDFAYIDSPATTSATTYKIQYMTDGSNLVQMTCSATSIASIIAIEVGA